MRYLIIIPILLLVFFGCTKKDPNPISPEDNSNMVEVNITASDGGSVSTNDGLRLEIPANAMSSSGVASLGYTGSEATSVPNGNFQIARTAFTIKLPVSKINLPIKVHFPIGSLESSADEYNLFLFNGTTFYPFEYTISGNTVTGTIDKID